MPAPALAAQGAKLTVAKPDEYDRSYDKFDHFLASLEINFITCATAFPNDLTKIFYVLLYMKKGLVQDWATNTFIELKANRVAFINWAMFKAELKRMFKDPNKKKKAQLDLKAIQQLHNESVDEFFTCFNHLKPFTEFNV